MRRKKVISHKSENRDSEKVYIGSGGPNLFQECIQPEDMLQLLNLKLVNDVNSQGLITDISCKWKHALYL